jgi:hypothetical protein
MKLMRSPAARRTPLSLELPQGVHRTTPSSRQPPGHGRCHRQPRSRARTSERLASIRVSKALDVYMYPCRIVRHKKLRENSSAATRAELQPIEPTIQNADRLRRSSSRGNCNPARVRCDSDWLAAYSARSERGFHTIVNAQCVGGRGHRYGIWCSR